MKCNARDGTRFHSARDAVVLTEAEFSRIFPHLPRLPAAAFHADNRDRTRPRSASRRNQKRNPGAGGRQGFAMSWQERDYPPQRTVTLMKVASDPPEAMSIGHIGSTSSTTSTGGSPVLRRDEVEILRPVASRTIIRPRSHCPIHQSLSAISHWCL